MAAVFHSLTLKPLSRYSTLTRVSLPSVNKLNDLGITSFGRDIPLLLLLAFLSMAAVTMTLAGLDTTDFVRQSECRTAVVAREMRDSGDFLVPTVNGRPRFEKPPLYYWAVAALAGETGEVSETVARLPSVLSALAAALVLGGFAWCRARLLGQPPVAAACLASLLLICLPGFWQRATLADAESLLALACIAVSVCLYWDLRQPRQDLTLMAYVLSAVAFLVKGPVFLIFTWPVYLWLTRRELKVQGRWHGLGLLLFLAGALSWYAVVLWLDPHALDVFRREMAVRFDSQEAPHPQPLWFYLRQLFKSTLPLGLFLPVAVYAVWQRRSDKAEAFLLGNGAVAFAFLTLLKTKQAHYLMPLLPWLALWLGDLAWSAWDRAWRWLAWAWLGVGGLLAATVAVLAYVYGALWLVPVFALLAVAAVVAARWAGDRPLQAALIWTAALVICGYAANEAVFKPLRGLKFAHSAYFAALRDLAATDGMVPTFDDACFYYYFGLPAQRAASPVGANYLLGADGTPLGYLRNYHRSRLEWLWQQDAGRVRRRTANPACVLSTNSGAFMPAQDLTQQTANQTSCLSASLWTTADAAVLKVAIDSVCSARELLPDLLAANDLLQSRLLPWKLLWLEGSKPPQGLRGWLLRQLLTCWAETSDAVVVLDNTGLLGRGGEHGVPLVLSPKEFNDASLSVGGAGLELTSASATRRWQRQADGASLNLRSASQK